jgi:hypothetical protein
MLGKRPQKQTNKGITKNKLRGVEISFPECVMFPNIRMSLNELKFQDQAG